MDNKIEITKEQFVGLMCNQVNKYNCTFVSYRYVDNNKYTGWSSQGAGLEEERYFHVNSLNCQKEYEIEIRYWDKVEDIPERMWHFDNSEKVEIRRYKDEDTKYFLRYISFMGDLNVIIEHMRENNLKVVYNYTLKASDA